MPDGRRRAGLICAAGATLGLVLVVVGSFLPWFHSGNVERNSYQIAAVIGRLLGSDNAFITTVLRLWLGTPLVSALCVAFFALRLTRTGATLCVLFTIVVGTTAVAVAVQASDAGGLLGISRSGPLTTAIGAVVGLIGAIGAAFSTVGRNRRTAFPESR